MNPKFNSLPIFFAFLPIALSGCSRNGITTNIRGETPKEQAHREMEERTGTKIGEGPWVLEAKKRKTLFRIYREGRKTLLSRSEYHIQNTNIKGDYATVWYLEINFNFRNERSSLRLMKDSLKWSDGTWNTVSSKEVINNRKWVSEFDLLSQKIKPSEIIGMSPKQVSLRLGAPKSFRHYGVTTYDADVYTYVVSKSSRVEVWYGRNKANRLKLTASAGTTIPEVTASGALKAFSVDTSAKNALINPNGIFLTLSEKPPFTKVFVILKYIKGYPYFEMNFESKGAHYS